MTKPLADRKAELEGSLEEVRLERATHLNRLRLSQETTYPAYLQREAARKAIRLLDETELELLKELDRLPETAWYGRLGVECP